MKHFLIAAAITVGMLTSCKNESKETENLEVESSETEQVEVITDTTQVTTDTTSQMNQDKVDAAHGHSH